MTKQTSLFRPEVYAAMQRKSENQPKHTEIEEALDLIHADKKLADFFKAYATKEGIYRQSTFSFRARKGGNAALFVAGEGPNEIFGSQEIRGGIYLGPRQNTEPVLFIYGHNSNIVPGESMGFSYGLFSKRKDGWVINIPEYNPRDSEAHRATFRVSRAELFELSKQDVLKGIERVVNGTLRK